MTLRYCKDCDAWGRQSICRACGMTTEREVKKAMPRHPLADHEPKPDMLPEGEHR